ncbi:hypothetical protein NUW58_g7018 [Xylaria curta]|uniref:Uncharacterized protein n=1 Tax=Xylaria curta TaxID=42375 RepID=A0ACC1NP96_9PEZI|nr:hypothetical protein NUW58_g7018 [Xylaria curta]
MQADESFVRVVRGPGKANTFHVFRKLRELGTQGYKELAYLSNISDDLIVFDTRGWASFAAIHAGAKMDANSVRGILFTVDVNFKCDFLWGETKWNGLATYFPVWERFHNLVYVDEDVGKGPQSIIRVAEDPIKGDDSILKPYDETFGQSNNNTDNWGGDNGDTASDGSSYADENLELFGSRKSSFSKYGPATKDYDGEYPQEIEEGMKKPVGSYGNSDACSVNSQGEDEYLSFTPVQPSKASKNDSPGKSPGYGCSETDDVLRATTHPVEEVAETTNMEIAALFEKLALQKVKKMNGRLVTMANSVDKQIEQAIKSALDQAEEDIQKELDYFIEQAHKSISENASKYVRDALNAKIGSLIAMGSQPRENARRSTTPTTPPPGSI